MEARKVRLKANVYEGIGKVVVEFEVYEGEWEKDLDLILDHFDIDPYEVESIEIMY
jgi:hypothetical protein